MSQTKLVQIAFRNQNIRDSVITSLFDLPFLILHKKIIKLANKNIKEQRIYTDPYKDYYFYFRGKKYFNRTLNDPMTPERYLGREIIDLLPEFHQQMIILINNKDKLIDERNMGANYFNLVLNNLETVNDIIAVLPQAVHKYINYTAIIPGNLSQEEIILFIHNNQKYYNILNQRVIKNLLLGKNHG